MVLRKTLQIDADLKTRFDKIRGKSTNDKLALLLDMYTRKIAEEDNVYKLINAHMNDIKEIQKEQNKEIEISTKEIKLFTLTTNDFIKWVQTGGHKRQ